MSVAAAGRRMRGEAFDHALAPVLPMLLGIVGALCLAAVIRAIEIIPLHVSLDPNEGWNAYHAAAAMSGQGLYPDPTSFMSNNYPPLSFYFIGWLGRLTGDPIVAGRIVSMLGFLCLCGLTAALAFTLGARRSAAAFSTVFVSAVLLAGSDYVGIDDPQLLGHAIQLTAALVAIRAPRHAWRVVLAAALFVAGGFIKHNLFALPLAALIWLALIDRRAAVRFAIAGAVFAAAGLFAFRLGFGFDLLSRLDSARLWSFAGLRNGLEAWLPFAAIPICALAALLARRPRDPAVRFSAVYAGVAIVTGGLMLGGAGVDANAMFDADIALALGAGFVIDTCLRSESASMHVAARAVALSCFLPLLAPALANADWRTQNPLLEPMRNDAVETARDIGFLRAHPGPAFCESLALCYWAGKQASVDVFNLDQQFSTRSRALAPFLNRIAEQHFSAIEFDETDPFPLPRAVERAIRRFYRIDHSDDEGIFFVPKPLNGRAGSGRN